MINPARFLVYYYIQPLSAKNDSILYLCPKICQNSLIHQVQIMQDRLPLKSAKSLFVLETGRRGIYLGLLSIVLILGSKTNMKTRPHASDPRTCPPAHSCDG